MFIIPEKRDLHVLDGEFRLKANIEAAGMARRDHGFLRSVTKHRDGKLIAVIVPGYDGDGAAALWA